MDNIGIPRDSVYYKYYQFMKAFNRRKRGKINEINNNIARYSNSCVFSNRSGIVVNDISMDKDIIANTKHIKKDKTKTQKRRLF